MNRRIDAWLILAAALLIVFGMVMVYSASAVVALEYHGDEAHYLVRQLIAVTAQRVPLRLSQRRCGEIGGRGRRRCVQDAEG